MFPRIMEARYIADFTIWVRFSDGIEGVVDLASDLTGPMFEPLRNVEEFRRFILHPELRTLVWPNGADLAPEYLRAKIRIVA